jgi:hypothetical protein
MIDQKWTWEVAYKKWFFLRFFLLLVVLGLCIILAYITFHREPENILAVDSKSLNNIFTGSWGWTIYEGTPNESSFGLNLVQNSDRVTGSYCASAFAGGKSDCDPEDKASINGVVHGQEADVTIHDAWMGGNLKAKIKYIHGNLEWQITNPPQAEYYIPDQATLKHVK